ncbi:NUDIX domain-containing protein [Maricaulis virginensis]|uniref:GDP-mannose pyrophosphatase n=1 Tax=Maricaulis virginensis TaxID=144022 RepID=A0A9W6IM77_9PROT|nr:NUDIX hydrolase [Maricaulis virginensis]GLK51615.1 DNA mismatch repair protein MutT [Maricaulis virginensis]
MNGTRGPWQVGASRTVYENPWLRLTEHDVTRPDGEPGLYGVVEFANLAIAILPLFEDGTTVLVGQHRFPQDRYSWEIPEGGGPLDVPPLDSARRELKEETGLEAANWREILRMDLSNSVTDEEAIGYIATGLTQGEAAPEGTEVLQTRRVPFRMALHEAVSGRITDALTVAMLLRAYYMAREGELDETLAAAMLQR